MRSYEKLNRIKEILPNNIRGGSECGKRMEIRLRHPHAEGGILLSESLPRSDGTDAGHGLRRSRRIDEYVLIIASFRGCRKFITDEFAETELEEAGDK